MQIHAIPTPQKIPTTYMHIPTIHAHTKMANTYKYVG
jgi:hypothetical protein